MQSNSRLLSYSCDVTLGLVLLVRRAELQMFEAHCQTFLKNSSLFALMHNKINERSGSGSGDGFMGGINTLTQLSQCRT